MSLFSDEIEVLPVLLLGMRWLSGVALAQLAHDRLWPVLADMSHANATQLHLAARVRFFHPTALRAFLFFRTDMWQAQTASHVDAHRVVAELSTPKRLSTASTAKRQHNV
jgi:hypothetical protein